MNYRHLFEKPFFLSSFSLLILCSSACSQNKSSAPVIRFTKQMIAAESFESVNVFDVNNDGKPDIVSGSFWYEGPDFFKAHYIGPVKRYNEYWDDFSTIPLDVNGDGRMDFITGSWFSNSLHWKENPGNNTGIWTDHLIDSTGNVEAAQGWDVDNDGTIEIVPNNPNFPLKFYKLEKDAGGKASGKFAKTEVAPKQGHGLGFGDINADGRGDFIISDGWLEAPANPLKETWVLHKEFNLGQASVPVLVEDVNGDGKNDIISGQGHDYGLDWYEQTMDKSGKRNWVKHAIDPNNSMFHTMQWVDIDGDGKPELITGKRYRAHDTDPGVHDPAGLYYYKWNGESFTKQIISYGPLGEGKGTGLYFAVADLRGTGRKDIVVAGKDGLYVFYNDGAAAVSNKGK
ncbi:Repeat domain-containing protein [Parafilimonas terrae]|uniref:Repeat domain-containing protein n=2 Tax=Parafilimonas terrae TaxID=1465490 RepID=A0A1I5RUV6_9BACT|nr:Repeat domain-containing protein [Parafilimonas terrae]